MLGEKVFTSKHGETIITILNVVMSMIINKKIIHVFKTLMALVSPLKIQRKYHMPWIGFMNGMSHYYLGGGVVQITTEPIWVILYGAYH